MEKQQAVTHDDLLFRYGKQMDPDRWRPFFGVTIGPAPAPRADLVLIRTSYGKEREIRIIECKVSTADLRQDVLDGKYRKYIPYCDRLYFLLGHNVDASILDSVPEAGVIRANCNRYVTKRAARWNGAARNPLSEEVLLALIFSHFRSDSPLKKYEKRREFYEKMELRQLQYAFSTKLNERISNLLEREARCAELEANAERRALDTMRQILGVTAPGWKCNNAREILAEALKSEVSERFQKNLNSVVDIVLGPTKIEKSGDKNV